MYTPRLPIGGGGGVFQPAGGTPYKTSPLAGAAGGLAGLYGTYLQGKAQAPQLEAQRKYLDARTQATLASIAPQRPMSAAELMASVPEGHELVSYSRDPKTGGYTNPRYKPKGASIEETMAQIAAAQDSFGDYEQPGVNIPIGRGASVSLRPREKRTVEVVAKDISDLIWYRKDLGEDDPAIPIIDARLKALRAELEQLAESSKKPLPKGAPPGPPVGPPKPSGLERIALESDKWLQPDKPKALDAKELPFMQRARGAQKKVGEVSRRFGQRGFKAPSGAEPNLPEPKTKEEFDRTGQMIADENIARKYFEKWRSKFYR